MLRFFSFLKIISLDKFNELGDMFADVMMDFKIKMNQFANKFKTLDLSITMFDIGERKPIN